MGFLGILQVCVGGPFNLHLEWLKGSRPFLVGTCAFLWCSYLWNVSCAHCRSWLLMLRWKGSVEEKVDLLGLLMRWARGEVKVNKEEQFMFEVDRQGSDVGSAAWGCGWKRIRLSRLWSRSAEETKSLKTKRASLWGRELFAVSCPRLLHLFAYWWV